MNAWNAVTRLVVAALVALPVLWAATRADAQERANERWLEQIYYDVLGRPPDPAGRTLLTHLLNAGACPGQIGAILLNGQEYRTKLLQSVHRRYLDRPAEADELQALIDLVNRGGRIDHAVVIILGSDAYFRRSEGTTVAWVIQVYGDLLGRAPSGGELTRWTNVLEGGGTRESAADSLVDGQEYRTGSPTATSRRTSTARPRRTSFTRSSIS